MRLLGTPLNVLNKLKLNDINFHLQYFIYLNKLYIYNVNLHQVVVINSYGSFMIQCSTLWSRCICSLLLLTLNSIDYDIIQEQNYADAENSFLFS